MSDTSIAPGKTLTKALIHPTTGNVLLPAGTVLTQTYIDRLARQGLEASLAECLAAPEAGELGGRPEVKDLDAFDIEIPELPDILSQFMPAATAAPAAAPGWVPTGAAAATAHGQPSAPPSPYAVPGQPAAATPATTAPAPGWVPTGQAAPAAPAAPPAPAMRYYHNPGHLIPERAVYGAMQAVEGLEQQLKAGQMPSQDAVKRVVDELLDRLAAKAQDLNNGIELRITNQPHAKAHPVNVMMLSAVMGMGLGYTKEDLRTLAVGALFHDIGKTAIAPEVLHKQGPLTPQDIELLRAHPLIGKRIMDKLPWANPTMGQIVYQHHERMNGSGYPLRLQGAQILEMSRIVAVAEVYDSLVSDTEWRPRYAPELAYNLIKGGEKEGYDPNVIRAFCRVIFPYPLHSFVLLDDNSVGQVVQVNRANPVRPLLKIGNSTVDLASQSDRRIVNSHYQAFY